MLNQHIKIQHKLLLFCFTLNLTQSNDMSKAKAILHFTIHGQVCVCVYIYIYIYIIHEKDQVFP